MIFNVFSNKILWNTLSKYFNKAISYDFVQLYPDELVRNQRTKFVLVSFRSVLSWLYQSYYSVWYIE